MDFIYTFVIFIDFLYFLAFDYIDWFILFQDNFVRRLMTSAFFSLKRATPPWDNRAGPFSRFSLIFSKQSEHLSTWAHSACSRKCLSWYWLSYWYADEFSSLASGDRLYCHVLIRPSIHTPLQLQVEIFPRLPTLMLPLSKYTKMAFYSFSRDYMPWFWGA